ncbi:hypothetical protein [Sabulicella rubraurantiaca]|uniref:hypothetical protein n=1 Tax=Sabulicella rubraurantiaca TaxID=2811429 RepID=UPI001A962CA1|nr:hypothetical protein [Sabulicella rubraurantiaca]
MKTTAILALAAATSVSACADPAPGGPTFVGVRGDAVPVSTGSGAGSAPSSAGTPTFSGVHGEADPVFTRSTPGTGTLGGAPPARPRPGAQSGE